MLVEGNFNITVCLEEPEMLIIGIDHDPNPLSFHKRLTVFSIRISACAIFCIDNLWMWFHYSNILDLEYFNQLTIMKNLYNAY